MSPKLFNFLLVILPVVLYFGYLNPAYTGTEGLVWTPTNSILSLQAQNVQYANTLNQISLVEQGALDFNKDYNGISEEKKDKMEIMLPDEVDQIKLRNEIILIAGKSNIAVQNLKVEKDTKGDKNLNFYTVSFDAKSKYPAFKKFMENYEKSMRFFILESASIERQQKSELDPNAVIVDDEVLNVAVTSRVYYMK